MGKQRTNKTAKKRVKITNPKGCNRGKLLVNKSHKHHLQTKKSQKTKRRKLRSVVVGETLAKGFRRKIINV